MCDGRPEKSCPGRLDARARLRLRLRAAELAALAMETEDPLERHRLITEAKKIAAQADQPSCDA
jgi:Family of unknown function (DUF6381)